MKKTILAVLISLSSFTVSASVEQTSYTSEGLYRALDVEVTPLAGNRMTLQYQKSVSGLNCIKTNVIQQGNRFSCSLDLNSTDPKALYHALNVEETLLAENRMTLKYQKVADRLTCTKTNIFGQGDSFSCSLSI